MKKIVISGNGDGTFKAEGFGFKGKECNTKMEDFEKALGKETKRRNKSDIFKQKRVNVQHH